MQIQALKTSSRSSEQGRYPAPGTPVATAQRVFWEHPIVVGRQTLGDREGWTSLDDAVAAVAQLTTGPVGAAGIFAHEGRFFARDLVMSHEAGSRAFDWEGASDVQNIVGLDPRIVSVVDGLRQSGLLSPQTVTR